MPPELPEAARPRWPWWYGPLAFLAGGITGFISAGIVWAAAGVDDPTESPGAIVVGTFLLDGSLVEDMPAFRRGNVLISMRHTHALAVLDLDAGTVAWAATGMWKLQHDPRVLPNGRILLFDNAGYGWSSQVIEVEPRTARIAWTYRGSPAESFFSLFCGAAQSLPNGNTLITESCQGRAFEVTRAGETVWSYRNPERAGPRGELIAALFEVERVPAEAVEDWLGR